MSKVAVIGGGAARHDGGGSRCTERTPGQSLRKE